MIFLEGGTFFNKAEKPLIAINRLSGFPWSTQKGDYFPSLVSFWQIWHNG
jgi:hypothetical protein